MSCGVFLKAVGFILDICELSVLKSQRRSSSLASFKSVSFYLGCKSCKAVSPCSLRFVHRGFRSNSFWFSWFFFSYSRCRNKHVYWDRINIVGAENWQSTHLKYVSLRFSSKRKVHWEKKAHTCPSHDIKEQERTAENTVCIQFRHGKWKCEMEFCYFSINWPGSSRLFLSDLQPNVRSEN